MQRRRREEIPEPPELGIINALRFGTDPLRFLDGVQARFEDITAVPIPGRAPLVIVTSPSLIHDALSRPEEFSRVAAEGTATMIAERGVVQSEGDLWRQQRSVMRPAFTGQQVRTYANTVGRRATELADEWAERPSPETLNLHNEMTTLTIRVASEILLGEDIGDGESQARTFSDDARRRASSRRRLSSPLAIAQRWFAVKTGLNRNENQGNNGLFARTDHS